MRSFLRFAFVFILLTGGAIAAQPVDHDKFLEWHKKMILKPLKKKGCFKAIYPKERWHKEACATPPNRSYLTVSLVQTAGHFVGNANNYSAQVKSGLISSAIGSFENVQMTSEGLETTPYTLQLNSEKFKTPLCEHAQDPAQCTGVQQFVYVPNSGSGYIQYTLVGYGPECPEPKGCKNTEWCSTGGDRCTRSSARGIPMQEKIPISDLSHLSIGGKAVSGGLDTLTVGIALRGELHATSEDSILSLASSWQMAEFGVFGDGNGTPVNFNPGTTITVRTSVLNGTTNAPECVHTGVTGEKNNLELVGNCCAYGGEVPGIVFRMSNVPGATSPCAGER